MDRTCAFALVVVALGSGACAAAGPEGIPPRSTGTGNVPDVASPCRVAGDSRVVAAHVSVPAGVEVRIDDGQAKVRFAHPRWRCTEARVVVETGSLAATEVPGACPGGGNDVVATTDQETLVAREATWGVPRVPHVELGVVVRDAPALVGFRSEQPGLVERVFEPPQPTRLGGAHHPGLVPIDGERFLLTWVDENPDGHGLHAQALAGSGEPVGEVLDLSPRDASVLGRASAVVGQDGRGIVVYLASGDHGFDVRATPILCRR